MSTAPDHAPSMDSCSGILSWVDPSGTPHRLHTDPAEAAAFFARAEALSAGRADLRFILDATAVWLWRVTDAGLPINDAVAFLASRMGREMENLTHLLVEDRLGDRVDQILSEDDDAADEEPNG